MCSVKCSAILTTIEWVGLCCGPKRSECHERFPALMAKYAWEQVNDVAGQSAWRWDDLYPEVAAKAIEDARRWLEDR